MKFVLAVVALGLALAGCADSPEPPAASSSSLGDQSDQITGALAEGETSGVVENEPTNEGSGLEEPWVPTVNEVCGLLDVEAFSEQVGTDVLPSDPTEENEGALDQEWTDEFPATVCTNYWDDGTGYFNEFGLGIGRPDDEWFGDTTPVSMPKYECGVFDDLSKTLVCRTGGWELWMRTGLEFPGSKQPMLSALHSFDAIEGK